MTPSHHASNSTRIRRALLALIAITVFAPAAAFDFESDAPIAVSANSARLDDSTGVATYTGDVVVTQNETRLTAERVVLERGDQGISRIEATGEPARYQQAAGEDQAQVDARARNIVYTTNDSQLIFTNDAVIEQGRNLFRGERILYDTAARVVTAEGGSDKDGTSGRVEMIIQPRGAGAPGNSPDDAPDNSSGEGAQR